MTDDKKLLNNSLPLLPLRKGVVFPGAVTTLPVGRATSRALVADLRQGESVAVAPQRDPQVEEPGLADLHPVAVLARVKDTVDRGDRGVLLVVEGLRRIRLKAMEASSPYMKVHAEPVDDEARNEAEARARADALLAHLNELSGVEERFKKTLAEATSPGLVADRVAAWLDVDDPRKAEVLGELDVAARLRQVTDLLVEVKGRFELKQRLDEEVRRQMTDAQREAVLRQQMRAIQKELGEEEDARLADLRERLGEPSLPEEVRRAADRELKRLEAMNPGQPEAHVILTYLETLADLPWTERAETMVDIDAVARVLDEDHHGLDDVKARILEHMAVLKLAGHRRGTVLCLAGPPGVGKTSLAQSVANAVGRPLVRISLGGVRDESEVRGHRRTYVGAMPGRVLAALRKVDVKNPVVVLDEVDKLGRGLQGDPEAALLELLDPEQNDKFVDHYVEVPFDLSEAMFIATANDLSSLSPPLRDRLEVIEVNGYTSDEKVQIARRHLLPKQIARHGLAEDDLEVPDDGLAALVERYTREAGVRQLERQIAKICRKVALEVARGGEVAAPRRLTVDDLHDLLGRRRFWNDTAERHDGPGVAAGLAWTPVGGDVLYVETTRMPGKGQVEITGQLGDVMRESARAALAYIRSHAAELGVDADFLSSHDLHIHVPAGAVPKDGPSAGVTLFTALASLLSGRPVRTDTAMTGEVTLRGRVLPVGGIKSKVLAAHRAGFKRVILPRRNEQDLEDVPELTRNDLEILLLDDMRDVLQAALMAPPRAGARRRGAKRQADQVTASA